MLFASARNLNAAASTASTRAFSFETSRDVAMKRPDRAARSGSGATTTSHHLRTPFIVGQAAVKRAMRPRRASLRAFLNEPPRLFARGFDPWLAKQRGESVRLQQSEPRVIYEADTSVNINQFDTIDARREQTITQTTTIAEEMSSPLNSIIVRSDNLHPSCQIQTRSGIRARAAQPGSTHESRQPLIRGRRLGQAAASRFVEALRSKNSA